MIVKVAVAWVGLMATTLHSLGDLNMGDDQSRMLVEALKHRDPETRRDAAARLGHLRSKTSSVVPALIEALGDEDQAVRSIAATALGKIGAPAGSAIPALVKLFKDTTESETVRSWAANSLGMIGQDSLPSLIDCLHDDHDTFLRSKSARAIGRIGSKAHAAVPDLVGALLEEDYMISYNAGESLVSIGASSLPALTNLLEAEKSSVRTRISRVILKIDPKNMSAIQRMLFDLKHNDILIREGAAQALRPVRSDFAPAVVKSLAEALKDEAGSVREVASSILAEIEPAPQQAIPYLIEALRDPLREVRGYSAVALGRVGSNSHSAVPALTESLDDKDTEVRILVARALGEIGPNAASSVSRLNEILRENDLDAILRATVNKSIEQISN